MKRLVIGLLVGAIGLAGVVVALPGQSLAQTTTDRVFTLEELAEYDGQDN